MFWDCRTKHVFKTSFSTAVRLAKLRRIPTILIYIMSSLGLLLSF